MRPSRKWFAILVLGLGLALVAGVVASRAVTTAAEEPPPGWSAVEWTELDSAKQSFFRDMAEGMQLNDPLTVTAPDPGPLGPDEDLLEEEAAEASDPPVGLTESESFTFLGRGFVSETSWGEMHDGVLTQVFTGTRAGEPEAGYVAVISWRWDTEFPDPRNAVYYRAPEGVGRLRITSVSDGVLLFRSANGVTGTFDLATREFDLAVAG